MNRSADFITTPEGIRTKDPRRAMRKDHQKGVWRHIFDLNELEKEAGRVEDDLIRSSSGSEFIKSPEELGRIKIGRVKQATQNGEHHLKLEEELKEVTKALWRLTAEENVDYENPYNDLQKLEKYRQKISKEKEALLKQESHIRQALDRSNLKLPKSLREKVHIPMADKERLFV